MNDPIHPKNSIRVWLKDKKTSHRPGQAFVVVVAAAAGCTLHADPHPSAPPAVTE